MSQSAKDLYLTNGVAAAEQDVVDKNLADAQENTIISYVAAPTNPKAGSYCYKMLINPQTYELYFFRKHRINSKYGAGFAEYDLRSIAMIRKEKKK